MILFIIYSSFLRIKVDLGSQSTVDTLAAITFSRVLWLSSPDRLVLLTSKRTMTGVCVMDYSKLVHGLYPSARPHIKDSSLDG